MSRALWPEGYVKEAAKYAAKIERERADDVAVHMREHMAALQRGPDAMFKAIGDFAPALDPVDEMLMKLRELCT